MLIINIDIDIGVREEQQAYPLRLVLSATLGNSDGVLEGTVVVPELELL